MTGMIGARSAARGAREPAAAAHGAREPAGGLVRPGGGTILDAIGSTPLILVDGIWVKLEFLNPSGINQGAHRQVHDRAGRARKGCCGRVTPSWRRPAATPATR